MRRRTWLAILIGALVAAVGATAATEARHPRDPQEKLNAADNARAAAIVVRRRDLAGTWKVEKATDDDSRCPNFDPNLSDLTVTGKATSPDFTRADGVVISSEVEIYETPEQVQASFDRAIRPQILRCMDIGFREGAREPPNPARDVKLLVARRAPMPRYGERNARYQMIWSLVVGGKRVRAHVDVYFVAKERVGLSVFFFGSPNQIAVPAERALLTTLVGRI